MTYATGEQYELARGRFAATITQVAAGIRTLTVDGIDLVEPFEVSSTPPGAAGIVLVPWPNRVADAAWTLDGKRQLLDITEPDKHNAIHGLLRHTEYRVVERTNDALTLAANVYPQHGYPFLLETSVTYRLVDDGLRVTHSVTNHSTSPAPYAVGAHPYLTIGGVATEELTLTVAASTRIVSDDRLIPIEVVPVVGTPFDLRAGRLVGELNLDEGFGSVVPVDGVSASLTAPDGRRVSLLQDDDWKYLQIFTPRLFPKASGPSLAIALEPMTAPANAFNTGVGLRWIDPGASWSGGWGIRYSDAVGAVNERG